MTDIDAVLRPREVAQLMKVDVSSIYRWVREGRLPGIKIGRTIRIHKEDFERIFFVNSLNKQFVDNNSIPITPEPRPSA